MRGTARVIPQVRDRRQRRSVSCRLTLSLDFSFVRGDNGPIKNTERRSSLSSMPRLSWLKSLGSRNSDNAINGKQSMEEHRAPSPPLPSPSSLPVGLAIAAALNEESPPGSPPSSPRVDMSVPCMCSLSQCDCLGLGSNSPPHPPLAFSDGKSASVSPRRGRNAAGRDADSCYL